MENLISFKLLKSENMTSKCVKNDMREPSKNVIKKEKGTSSEIMGAQIIRTLVLLHNGAMFLFIDHEFSII